MNKLKVVVGETYRRNVKSWSFLSMILAPFIMIGIMVLSGLASSGIANTPDIAIISDDSAIQTQLVTSLKENYHINEKITTAKEAEKAIDDEEIGGYLKVETKGDKLVGTFYEGKKGDRVGTDMMQQVLTQLQVMSTATNLDLSQAEVASLFTPAELKVEKMDTDSGDAGQKTAMSIAAMVVSLFMFFIIFSYATVIATEVSSEKGTRIMEVLLSSTTAQTQFIGKIAGILLVCLTQIGIYAVMGVAAYTFTKDMPTVKSFLEVVDLGDLVRSLFGYNALFFIIGVVGYCGLAALCGSLVSKAEDVSKAIQPITYLAMLGFMLGMMLGLNNPENIVIQVASYVPFVAPYTMPYLIAAGVVSTGGIILSLGISLVGTLVILYLSMKLYSTNVLVYNDNGFIKSLKESFTILKHEKVGKS